MRFPASLHNGLDFNKGGGVDDAEDVFAGYETEACGGGLEIVDCLAHVAFGAEDESGDTVVGVFDRFGLADLEEAADDLGVGEAGVAEDGAAGLDGFDDFVGGVAGEGEAGGGGVDFHGAAEGLLRAACHAVGLVEDDEFLPAGGESDFFLCEAFDAVADDVDAALVAGVELEDGFFVGGAEELAGETEDGGCFANAGHAADDYVRHVAIFGDDFKTLDCFGVAYYIVEVDWAVFLDPGKVLVVVIVVVRIRVIPGEIVAACVRIGFDAIVCCR